MDSAGRRRLLILRGASLVVVITAWLYVRFRRRSLCPAITYAPMLDRDIQRQTNLRFIYQSNDTHYVDQLRMKRAPFFQLCDLFRARCLLRDSIHCSIEEQVAMFLNIVSHNHRFRVIQPTFRGSFETIGRYFAEVLYAVGELRNEMIVPPCTAVPPKVQNSRRWNPYFKVCSTCCLYLNFVYCSSEYDRLNCDVFRYRTA